MTNTNKNDIKLSGLLLFAFWQKCIKSGVPEIKEILLHASQAANIVFSENYDSAEPILQKQFIANCTIECVNNQVRVYL